MNLKNLGKALVIDLVWLFLLLIVGFAILNFLGKHFNNVVGHTAERVEDLARGEG